MAGPRIRACTAEDAIGVAALHARIYPGSWPSQVQCAAYVRDVLFHNPWYDPELPSWVAEEAGTIVGFLGVLPRRMIHAERVVRVAVGCQFMVDPQKRRSLMAFELLRRFLSGPQHISIADGANKASRALWESVGGRASALHDLHWTRLLRPARGLLALVPERLQGVATLTRPLAALADACVPARSPARTAPWREEELGAAGLAAALEEHRGAFALRPQYDPASLEWLLAQARAKQRHGVLQGCLLRDPGGRVAGWFLYYLNSRMSQVLQLGAQRERVPAVLERLFQHARARGAVAIQGRLEPHMAAGLQGKACLLQNRGIATMLHARDASLLLPFYRGDSFFSRLDGEWWMRFSGGAATPAPRVFLRRPEMRSVPA
jgi:Acetyltransferase (GNAT) family